NELKEWEEKHAPRLKIIHVLSRPDSSWKGYCGRIDHDLIAQTLKSADSNKEKEFYLCGPTGFMECVRNSLTQLGVSKDLIREEDFAIDVHKNLEKKDGPVVQSEWTFIGPQEHAESPEKIIAIMYGETVEVAAK